jgi:outer membrane protein assembly factor BamB
VKLPPFHKYVAITVLAVAFAQTAALAGDNWPQWRGPSGNGLSDSTNLPTTWNLEKNENIVWKSALPSWSGGTPIIWGDVIFVTSPTPSTSTTAPATRQPEPKREPPPQPPGGGFKGKGGKGGGGYGGDGRDPGGPILMLLCLSKKDGKTLWQRELDEGNRTYRKQNCSSPSPVTDGKHVWVVTGTGAVAAFDFDGKQLWKRNIQRDYGNFGLNWGYASSPLLLDGKLIIEVLHGNNTDDPSYLVAFDGMTGKEVWRKERPTDAVRESPDAYTTPALLKVNGKSQIVVSGGDYVTAHDPATGEEIWRASGINPNRDPNYRIIASPIVADGMIFAPTRRKPLVALRAGGVGEITKTHTAWKYDAGPDVPTPISDGKYFYSIDDQAIVSCLDAKTGKVIYGPERTGLGGVVSASPLLADGKIYITNEAAQTLVIAAGPEYKKLATNDLDGTYTLSSIAVSGQQLFLRTSTHLYCIGNEKKN